MDSVNWGIDLGTIATVEDMKVADTFVDLGPALDWSTVQEWVSEKEPVHNNSRKPHRFKYEL